MSGLDELRKEHSEMLCELHRLVRADIRHSETQQDLANLHRRVRAHLDHEGLHVYGPLAVAGQLHRNIASTLRIFSADTSVLTGRILAFFEQYEAGVVVEGFPEASERALLDLRERIRREEKILYPELVRIGAPIASKIG